MNLTDALQATVAKVDSTIVLRTPPAFVASEANTFSIHENEGSGFSIGLVAHTMERCGEICARVIDDLNETDLCECYDLAEFSQAKVEYHHGMAIRDQDGAPRGYRMFFTLDAVAAEQTLTTQEAA